MIYGHFIYIYNGIYIYSHIYCPYICIVYFIMDIGNRMIHLPPKGKREEEEEEEEEEE